MKKKKTTLSDIVTRVSIDVGARRPVVTRILMSALEQMKQDMIMGYSIEIRRFGTFKVTPSGEVTKRRAVLPNGEETWTGSRGRVKFKPGKGFEIL